MATKKVFFSFQESPIGGNLSFVNTHLFFVYSYYYLSKDRSHVQSWRLFFMCQEFRENVPLLLLSEPSPFALISSNLSWFMNHLRILWWFKKIILTTTTHNEAIKITHSTAAEPGVAGYWHILEKGEGIKELEKFSGFFHATPALENIFQRNMSTSRRESYQLYKRKWSKNITIFLHQLITHTYQHVDV